MLQLVEADITQAKVDAIVNAANPSLLGGGGVDGAIHRAAGPDLLAECQAIVAKHGQRCPTGEARITHAGNLPAKYVIHTVGPVYHEHTPEQAAGLLEQAYSNSLELALRHACTSIAFPAISCGVYAYPHKAAAKLALEVCRRPAYAKLNIQFCLYGSAMLNTWLHSLMLARKHSRLA